MYDNHLALPGAFLDPRAMLAYQSGIDLDCFCWVRFDPEAQRAEKWVLT